MAGAPGVLPRRLGGRGNLTARPRPRDPVPRARHRGGDGGKGADRQRPAAQLLAAPPWLDDVVGAWRDQAVRWGTSRATMLTCFYSAEALYAIMLGVPQLFQVAVRRTLSLSPSGASSSSRRLPDCCCPRPSPRAAPRPAEPRRPRPHPPTPHPRAGAVRPPPPPPRNSPCALAGERGRERHQVAHGHVRRGGNCPDVIGARCRLAEESAIRAARILFKRATLLSAVHVDWTLGPCTGRWHCPRVRAMTADG